MRAARSSISNEINAKIDAQDKFNRIKKAVQDVKKTGDKSQLTRTIEGILAERPIDINSRISNLEQLRKSPARRKEFIQSII